MWAIENETSFAVERTFVRDKDGAEIWLVALRATFDLFPDGSTGIADEQVPVATAPAYHGGPGASSLRWDTDLPRTKPATDILLNASAHVPAGRDPQTEIDVGFRIGSLAKRLSVRGDVRWERRFGGTLGTTPPEPFQSMPIRYERAFGGKPLESLAPSMHAYANSNPVGTGVMPQEGLLAPSVRLHGQSWDRPSSVEPAGLGAICAHWSPRRELAGTYDAKWQHSRRPLLPTDFQDTHYQSAPRDQVHRSYLVGGETVELVNLTPSGAFTFQLPKHSFGFRTSIAGRLEHHRGDIHSLIIEPDQQRLIMVWHTALPCHSTLYTLQRTVVYEKKRVDHREQAA